MKKLLMSLVGTSVLVFGLAACSEVDTTEDTTDTKAAETTKEEKVSSSPAPAEKKEEAKAEPLAPVDLGPGKFKVGDDIKPGRYVVSTQSQSGNFMVYGTLGLAEVNEILGTDESFAVNNVTVTLEEGQEVEIASLNSVHFEPKN
ncbi:hypothetical protein CPT_Moonbeam223 [Bacillus phage Moonbeam]|uniref:Lipoprotein n=1 Tax=Bacillus phage Moonbeam TaxID=1540091 RepID=A0A0A0RSV1_9CAUD|nr:hypothetical protein CPT_Moonbeam223 [Bacillus phage Moonbeam]AIW03621.1 hypothetical protein CPT_Moonbeam223 [Bacillus phage Moonbeam]